MCQTFIQCLCGYLDVINFVVIRYTDNYNDLKVTNPVTNGYIYVNP